MERQNAKRIGNLLLIIGGIFVAASLLAPILVINVDGAARMCNIFSYMNYKIGFGTSLALIPFSLLTIISSLIALIIFFSKKYWKYNSFLPFVTIISSLIGAAILTSVGSYIACGAFYASFVLGIIAQVIITKYVSEKVTSADENKDVVDKVKKKRFKKNNKEEENKVEEVEENKKDQKEVDVTKEAV